MHESGQADDDVLLSPDGGYGWVVVGSCFILNALTWGVTASFGVYLTEYVSSERFANAKPLEYGLVGGLNFSCAMLLAPLATHLAGRYPLKAVVLLGCSLQSIGYVTAPFASRAWHLYLTQGALVGSGIGFVIVPSTAVLSQWFSKRRSMANGISSAGSGVGGAAFTWGTAAMIKLQGLDWALRATGIITLVGIVIATLLLRHRNSQIQPNQRAFDIALLRSRAVALLLMWAFTTMFGYVVLLFSLSEFALAIGLSRKQATDIVGFLNVGTAIGRPLIGLRFTNSVAQTIGPLSAEVAGIQNLQATLSLAWAATILPAASAEVIALMLQGLPAPRTYVYPQVFAGLAYVIASGFLAALWINLRHRDSASQTRRLPGGIGDVELNRNSR
ncbi:hypothetical protein FocTR4_00000193 [Fusarium oxysporum f. sp. cubense]|uniref:Major facilitator superfamily (MFS) profile domain-containing protein n=1 Tax=Fusarium oxysporum f. sp. cubense TaxID=61366 RepID=A0A5C6SZK4_FUSOC|nr:hypothetical protein FocTR4_00000193 [Fusarium oxysporum f. sp. cubense]